MPAYKKDICVIGIGRFGLAIVEQLVNLRKNVLAVDKDEQKLNQVSRMTETAIVDGADIEGLEEIGIQSFNTIIVACSENVETIATLSELGVKNIIAKARSERHARVLSEIGVSLIVRPEAEAGIRTAFMATNPNFIKYSENLQEIGDGYAMGTTIMTNMNYIDRPIKTLNLNKLGVNIVSIKRASKVIIPDGNTHFRSNDTIALIGKIIKITKAFHEFNDEYATKVIKLNKIESAFKKKKSKT